MRTGPTVASRVRRPGLNGFGPWLLTAASVWLGWQIVLQPVTDRAPPAMAIRLAPQSPSVLRRAAEAELAAGRIESARSLATEALSRAPFDARALRTLGLAEDRRDPASANEILTLAGNWSLRDDPAHAWLLKRRLEQGNYGSAFAHADTLVRRRTEAEPKVFAFFTTAASQDPRALPALTQRLAASPPWRLSYIDSLYKSAAGYQVAVNLAIALERTEAAFTDAELHQLYVNLLDSGRAAAIAPVRARLDRPPGGVTLVNGDFGDRKSFLPFAWNLPASVGVISEILPSPGDGGPALRVEHSGLSAAVIAEQLMTLPPGAYGLKVVAQPEVRAANINFRWTVSCANSRVLAVGAPSASDAEGKVRIRANFVVPPDCHAQWLRLNPAPSFDTAAATTWFDDVEISRDR